MVERSPWLQWLAHLVLLLGVLVVALPVYITFVASTHTTDEIIHAPMPMLGANMNIQTTPATTGATAFFLFVINMVYAFFDTFAIVDAATKGGPGKETAILVYKVYYDGFKALDLGGSAARSEERRVGKECVL